MRKYEKAIRAWKYDEAAAISRCTARTVLFLKAMAEKHSLQIVVNKCEVKHISSWPTLIVIYPSDAIKASFVR